MENSTIELNINPGILLKEQLLLFMIMSEFIKDICTSFISLTTQYHLSPEELEQNSA